MSVNLTSGATNISNANLVGRSVGDICDDEGITSILSLEGNESTQVRHSNSDVFETVDSGYFLVEGDTLRFERSAGTKG